MSRVEGRAGAREAVGGAPVRLVRRDVAVGVVGYDVVVGEPRGGVAEAEVPWSSYWWVLERLGGENVLDTSVDHAVGERHEHADCCAGDHVVLVVEVVDDFRRGDDGCSKGGSIEQYQLPV